MKKIMIALCCCALLTQAVTAQEKTNYANREMTERHADQDAKQTYMGSEKIIGSYVYGTNNESVGDFNSVVLDEEGKICCAIVGVGGVAGVGETEIAVPWEAFNCECIMEDGEKSCRATLPMSVEQLRGAPQLEADEYGDLYDDSWVETNAKFYGVKSPATAPKKDSMICVSDINGSQLTGDKGMETAAKSDADQETRTSNYSEDKVDLGTIEDVVFDLKESKAFYIIVGDDSGLLSEKHVAIPFSQVKFSKKENEYCAEVAATARKLEAAPNVTPGEYKELDLESVRKQIDDAYMSN